MIDKSIYPEYYACYPEVDVLPCKPAQIQNPDNLSAYLIRTTNLATNIIYIPKMESSDDITQSLAAACSDLWKNGIDLITFQNLIDQRNYTSAAQHFKQQMDITTAHRMLLAIKNKAKSGS